LTRDDIAAATGVRPPLLAEVLGACAGRIRLDVELKEDGYVADVMAALRASADVAQMVVTSFLPAVIAQAKDAFPEIKTGLLVGTDAPPWRVRQHYRQLFPVGLARKVRADYLAPHFRLARFGVVRRAAAAGLPCLLWTVNDDADISKFAADPRVAAIITDEAAKAVAIVAQAGARRLTCRAGQRAGMAVIADALPEAPDRGARLRPQVAHEVPGGHRARERVGLPGPQVHVVGQPGLPCRLPHRRR
jgi:glycerophosphoryl diester phosphodiesterase